MCKPIQRNTFVSFTLYLFNVVYDPQPFLGARMKKLLTDVDTGVDDAQAIMMALVAPNVEILGITCVHGNTSLENACKNTLRVLKVCGRLDVGFKLLVILICVHLADSFIGRGRFEPVTFKYAAK